MQKICSPYDIKTIFTRGSTLQRYLFCIKPPAEFNRTMNCGQVYKGKICCPHEVRQEEHWKAVVRGEIEKLGMVDHIWKEKRNHLPLWDEVKIIDREEHRQIRRLKELAHMLGYLLSWPSIEMNTIWEPIIKKVR